MRRMILRMTWVVTAALFITASTARAEDDAPAVLGVARERMRLGDWDTAYKALTGLLARGPDVPGVRGMLPEIEQQLKVCLYRKDAPRPTPQDLFGPGGVRVAAYGRRVDLLYANGPSTESGWIDGGKRFWLLPIRFEKDVTLVVDAIGTQEGTGNQFLIFWDPDKVTGLSFIPGYQYVSGERIYTLNSMILGLRGDQKALEIETRSGSDAGNGGPSRYEIQCKTPSLSMKWKQLIGSGPGLKVSGPESSVKGSSTHAREGVIAMRAHAPRNVTIKGVVTEMELNARVTKFHDRGFEQWEKTHWKREAVMPRWALTTATVGSARFVAPLPRGVDPAAVGPLMEALEHYHHGRYRNFLAKAVRLVVGDDVASRYLHGLLHLVTGASASAEEAFTSILNEQPDFAAAHVGRAQARYGKRDIEGAKADLGAAGEAGALQPEFFHLRVSLAVMEGSLPQALQACEQARERGALLGELVPLEAWVRRTIQGPTWQKRFEVRTDHATVYSDHSVVLCRDVASLIGNTMQDCRKVFPGLRTVLPPLRVFIFSGEEGYLKYAAEAGRDLEHSAGAYIPFTREIVLFVPEIQAESFWRTVKHETFHAFLHGFIEDAPLWFNEGWAQWFENGKHKGEALLVDGVSADRVDSLRHLGGVKALAPLAKFMSMEPESFMANAELHYAQAEALIQFLNKDKSRWKQPLRQYAEGLFAGQSAQEAFDTHWKHLLFDLEREFGQFVGDILTK